MPGKGACSAEIDFQHRVVTDYVSLMRESLMTGATRSAIKLELAELARFARLHFAFEESAMRAHGYPAIRIHAHEHLALSGLIALLERTGERVSSIELMLRLEQQMLDHLGSRDALFDSWLEANETDCRWHVRSFPLKVAL